MPKPSNEKNARSSKTRTRILDAAAKVFRRKGYEAATLKEIGKLAKVQGPAIYYHFASKKALFEEVLHIGIDRIHVAVRKGLEEAPPEAIWRERIELAIRIHLETLLRHSDYTAANIINYGLAPRAVRARHHVHREAYGDCWRELFRAAREAGAIGAHVDLSLLRLFLIGALDWSHEWYRPGEKSIAALARDITDMLFDGIE